jgi:MinD-like ATPase involved in chromosome partitioning or flagellar assembly
VDLPTYTNIWRIEKRLYKLYDLRLPMPLPLGQIAAFVGITVPYVLFLTLIGIPFNHNLFWLYVLPPWAITWLATRPVLENKRLSELLVSQVRYIGEPKVWCRMAPAAEKDEVTVTARVWHSRRRAAVQPADSRARAPQRLHADPGARPAWAPAPGASRRRIEPRHRRAAAQRALPATAAGRVPVRAGSPVRGGPPSRTAPARAAAGNSTGPIPVRNGPARPATAAVSPASLAAHTAPAAAHTAPAAARDGHTADSGPIPVPVRNEPGLPPVAPGVAQWARHVPGSALDSRAIAHDTSPPGRAVSTRPARTVPPANARPPLRPGRPGSPPPATGRPEWATRAHPGPIGGWPAGAPGPRDLEVAHAENGRPVKKSAPRPGWDPMQPAASASSAAPARPHGDGAEPGRAARRARAGRLGRGGGQGRAGQVTAPETVAPVRSAAVVRGPVASAPVSAPRHGEAASPGGPRGRTVANRPVPAVSWVPARPNATPPVANGTPAAPPASPGALTRPAPHPAPAAAAQARAGGDGRAASQEERDRARARMPLSRPQRIVVLGCTSGAGQTVTALLTARMLATLRGEPVGALDLNPGDGSLARRFRGGVAGTVPELLGTPGATLPADPAPGVEVIADGDSADHDFTKIGERLAARYRISLVDPGSSGVGKVLAMADQLILVAPASADAPRAVTMTRQWLDKHDHRGLAAGAIMVVNGVSARSLADVERAEAIMVGRCRAIIRVPWEDQFGAGNGPCAGTAPLRQPARQAITELAGVLVSGLAAGSGDQQ